eukprot:7824758-Pyramimonas_sp.AAC.1
MRPLPPRSAAEICHLPWQRAPSLIHAPLIHTCDRLNSAGAPFATFAARAAPAATARRQGSRR